MTRTNSQMSIDTCITSSTSQVLILAVRDVEVSLRVTVFLGQAEVNNVDLISTLPNAHEKVIGFDVTVNKGFGVDVLDTRYKLISEEQHCLQGEFSVAEIEQILQTWSKQIKDHRVVITFSSKPADEGDTDTTSKGFVNTSLIFELRVLGLNALELNGDLFARNDVGACDVSMNVTHVHSEAHTEVNIPEATTADFTANTVLVAHTEILYAA